MKNKILKDWICFSKVVTPTREDREKHGAQIKEYILEDNACPLSILMSHPTTAGTIIFQIRRCTPDILAIRKAKKKAEQEKQQKMQSAQSQANLQAAQKNPTQSPTQLMVQPLRANLMNTQQVNEPAEPLSHSNEVNGINGNGSKVPCLIELSPGLFFITIFISIQFKINSKMNLIFRRRVRSSVRPSNSAQVRVLRNGQWQVLGLDQSH